MAISGVNPKCYILALFVRDDGARFLLGDDPFEFKDNQLHFQQNTMANDVVEVQGNDGYLLAGQVRRPGTQMFDGYVCNGTNSKEEVEAKRRSFLQFFRRSHFYKVIYVFPNGTAIQRKQGFLVDDPTVQELYQQYPEYHVALNFEDVNYYTYEEDDQGHEIYAKEAIVPLARGGATGGLIWDSYGVVWEDPWSLPLSISGVQFQILNNAGVRAPIDNVELYGDTYQQTYSGKNLFNVDGDFSYGGNYADQTTKNGDGTITVSANFSASRNAGQKLNLLANTEYILSCTMTATTSTQTHKGIIEIMKGIRGVNLSTVATNYVDAVGATSFTFTTPADVSEIWVEFSSNGTSATSTFANIQIEQGSTPTSYEPYTGGIPAPNPDYPQDIQVVTGEQTVKVNGKNIVKIGTYEISGTNYELKANLGNIKLSSTTANGSFDLNAGIRTGAYLPSYGQANDYHLTGLGGTYIVSAQNFVNRSSGSGNVILQTFTNKRTNGRTITTTATSVLPVTISLDDDEYIKSIYIWTPSSSTIDMEMDIQLEEGSTATSYEPYQGQSYPISLGTIELCKIGTYQDYIYKSSDDWYVHKETNFKQFNGSESWNFQTSGSASRIASYDTTDGGTGSSAEPGAISNIAISRYSTTNGSVLLSGTYTGRVLFFVPSADFPDQTTWTNFVTTNRPYVYYALATPTDTKITDATLVGQLEALGAMKLFIGENNGLVSATEPNLPATLAFDYYTKFTNIGAEWEEGGTKGATIVNVDAIDNTYPVWELTGPATNPTLSVLTTNTALTYNGTITGSQKLVIDMFNKTATLNGTSVIGNISGDFVYMAPGTNRLAYTAGNTDAPDSTIYWQEVVG